MADRVGAPVAETVPDAAGVVLGLLGMGNGADELGTMTVAEELGTTTAEELGTTTAVEAVVTAACVELLTGGAGAEVAGFGAAEVVLPKLAGRVMPLAAAQSAGVSPWNSD